MTAYYLHCTRCGSLGTSYAPGELPRTWTHVYGRGDYCAGCARALRDLESQQRPVGHGMRGKTA